MTDSVVTLKLNARGQWYIAWWRASGSSMSSCEAYTEKTVAVLAARQFAINHRMAFLNEGDSFLSIQKRDNIYQLVDVKYQEKPVFTGQSRITLEKILEIGDKIAHDSQRMFLPYFFIGLKEAAKPVSTK